MNRPNQAYCFLADKHYKSNYKILSTFADELVTELIENEDGVQMPHPFGEITVLGLSDFLGKSYPLINEHKVRGLRYLNHHTDGLTFSTDVFFRAEYGSGKIFRRGKYYKFFAYKPIKEGIKKAVDNDKWRHFRVFPSKYKAQK